MRTLFFPTVLVGIAAAVTSCQSSSRGGGIVSPAPPLTTAAANAAGLSVQQVADASALYLLKCAKCHKFYEPADYSEKEWEVWMRKMSHKSRLKPAQDKLLRQYLGAFREQHSTSPTE